MDLPFQYAFSYRPVERLVYVQGISWKRYPQLPVPSGIDSLHWTSVHSKYLLYEISCITVSLLFIYHLHSDIHYIMYFYSLYPCVYILYSL